MLVTKGKDSKAVHNLVRVLVADDSSVARQIVRRGVNAHRDQCYLEICCVEDGQTALEMLIEKPFDLAFIDINMPGLTGPQLIAALQQTASKDCLTVAMSSALDQQTAKIFKEFGAYHFMEKPFSANDAADVFLTFLLMTSCYPVLVVDDSATMRKVTCKILDKSRFLFDVFEAEDAHDAIKKLPLSKPRLVITDFHMPGVDGLELAGAIHAACDSIKIYMMSTTETTYLERSAAFVGVSGFLKKPFTPADIDCIMHDMLGLNHPRFGKMRNMFSFQSRGDDGDAQVMIA